LPSETISILDGATFLVSDRRGDIDASPDEAHGFFYRDTRFLSRWTLTVNGHPLDTLSTDETSYFSAQFFLVPPTGTVNTNPTVSILRKRSIGDGFHEDITVLNHDVEPLEVELRLEADADFADLFEVKDALAKKGERSNRVEGDTIALSYRRDDFVRETRIRVSKDAQADEHGFTLRVRVDPHSEWNTCVFVQPVTDQVLAIKHRHDDDTPKPNIGMSLDAFLAAAPAIETDSDALEHVYERSLIDLAALRFESPLFPGSSLPAAGLPWFMTVFGRDSLIASLQALPLDGIVGSARVVDGTALERLDAESLDSLDLDGERILLKTRNSELWERDTFADEFLSFSGDGAAHLVARGVRLIGIDYLSVGGEEAHHALLEAGVVAVEGLDLRGVEPGEYQLVCAPLKLVGSDGAPARVLLLR